MTITNCLKLDDITSGQFMGTLRSALEKPFCTGRILVIDSAGVLKTRKFFTNQMNVGVIETPQGNIYLGFFFRTDKGITDPCPPMVFDEDKFPRLIYSIEESPAGLTQAVFEISGNGPERRLVIITLIDEA